MSRPLRLQSSSSTLLLAASTILLAMAIFLLDTLTPLEIAAAVFYVAVVLLPMRCLTIRGVTLVAAGCVGLSVLSYLLTYYLLQFRGSDEAGVVNLTISIVAIVATTFLAAELRESEARRALALEAADLGAWDYDLLRGKIAFDLRGRSLLGVPPGAAPIDCPAFLSRVHPTDHAQVDTEVRRALDPAGSGHYEAEYRIIGAPDGGESWVAAAGRVEFDSGRAVRMRGVVGDTSVRKRAELHRELLVNELNHRVKNSLATVQAIAQKTLRSEADPVVARAHFTARIRALARAHDMLTRRSWEDAELIELVAEALRPHREAAPDHIRLEGPPVRLSPKAALALYMAIYELGGNAVKYGALSNNGSVEVRWTVVSDSLRLVWSELEGPAVKPPSRKGLGTDLLEQGLAGELDAEVQLDYQPGGLVCTIDAPLQRLIAR